MHLFYDIHIEAVVSGFENRAGDPDGTQVLEQLKGVK
jgi:hypothetical protein